MQIKIKKLHKDALIPNYQTADSSGFDFHSLEDVFISPGETKLVKTGLAVAIPKGFELQIRPRSGLSLRTHLRIPNSPGTVDADFRHEICIILENTEKRLDVAAQRIHIKRGQRIAQGILCPVYQAEFIQVEELDETARGKGGFGHTGA